jgi:hypothetical protein
MMTMFDAAEFADKYSDHIVFATSAGTGTFIGTVWRVLPVEVIALIFAALFIALRVCIERWIKAHHARKVRRHKGKRRVGKSRVHVRL